MSIRWRSWVSVSPVRTAVRISGISKPFFAGQRSDLTQRAFQVFLDVIAQGLQRRDVKDLSAVCKIAAQRLAHQPINTDQECCQRLAGASGRGDERGAAGKDVRPALLLWLSGRTEFIDEPFLHQGMGPGQGFGYGGKHLQIITVSLKIRFTIRPE